MAHGVVGSSDVPPYWDLQNPISNRFSIFNVSIRPLIKFHGAFFQIPDGILVRFVLR